MNHFGFKAQPTGFWFLFENGWVLSVQFGRGYGCDRIEPQEEQRGSAASAEVCAWRAEGSYTDSTFTYIKPELVARMAAKLARAAPDEDPDLVFADLRATFFPTSPIEEFVDACRDHVAPHQPNLKVPNDTEK